AEVMKAGIGVAVKRGGPKPDISTDAASKQTLLNAKSITYLKEDASTRHLVKVLAQLGIADSLEPKRDKPATESVSKRVAAGECGRRGRARHHGNAEDRVGAGCGAGRPAAGGDPVLHHFHGGGVAAVGHPVGRAPGDRAAAEPRRRAVDPAEGDAAGVIVIA